LDTARFRELPLMGIARGIRPEEAAPLAEAVIEAGLGTIEITMNTDGAAGMIACIRGLAAGRMAVGAGTVLSRGSLEEALAAGAEFIVMPVLVPEVAEICVKRGIPFFPGALTPQEVMNAWNAGATMVKVFPSGVFGPGYMRELKGPFDRVSLMAVGGVRPENIAEYFECGADAVAFGSSVFKREWLESGDFRSIGELAGRYVRTVKEAYDEKMSLLRGRNTG
jgi:2-dehydro-3-deoxyphosphogluconate aldolase / (4S)-4-hydroxy-2-oxoglutarate aldolase